MQDHLIVALMLFAGLLHASWHSLVKYGAEQVIVLAGMGLVAAVTAAVTLPFLPPLSPATWPVIGVSVALHVGYKLALARSYGLGDLGQAYPLARGFVPLFATLFATLMLGQPPSSGQSVGVAIVSAGLIWLALHSVRGGVDRRLFVAAIITGATVAGYSVVDAYGTRLNGNWASFAAWLIVVDSLTFSLLLYAMKGNRLWLAIWDDRKRIVASGLLGVLSFAIFIWALSQTAVSAVSALRECSVLFATIIGMTIHGEKKTFAKIAAALLIFSGIAVITLAER